MNEKLTNDKNTQESDPKPAPEADGGYYDVWAKVSGDVLVGEVYGETENLAYAEAEKLVSGIQHPDVEGADIRFESPPVIDLLAKHRPGTVEVEHCQMLTTKEVCCSDRQIEVIDRISGKVEKVHANGAVRVLGEDGNRYLVMPDGTLVPPIFIKPPDLRLSCTSTNVSESDPSTDGGWWQKLNDARSLLHAHGYLSDVEDSEVKARIARSRYEQQQLLEGLNNE